MHESGNHRWSVVASLGRAAKGWRILTPCVLLVVVFWGSGQISRLSAQPAVKNAAPPNATGQPAPGEEKKPAEKESPRGFLGIVAAGGQIGFLIILLSVVAVALCIQQFMALRRATLMPPALAEQFRTLLPAGRIAEADQLCKLQPSLLSRVLHAGLIELEGGWEAIEKAMEEALAEQAARLMRTIEYLSLISNVAPMLGLLGTVVGMIFAFREVAETQGQANAADLAQGIYLALVTTVEGLVVAIPAIAAYAVFRNQIDQRVAEAAALAQHAFMPFKRRLGGPPAPPQAPRARA